MVGIEGSVRRQKPKGGLKGFFKKPGLRPKSPGAKVGNVETVDVSHLVDDEEEYNQMMVDPPLETSLTKHSLHNAFNDIKD